MPNQRSFLSLLLLSLTLVLTGCQSFSQLFSDEPKPVKPQPLPVVELDRALLHDYQLTDKQSLIGRLATIKTQPNDTFSDIARHFGLGFNEISIANPGIAPWVPPAGTRVVLPTQFILPDAPRNGIVLNQATMRMFYYPKNSGQVFTYPVGIGRDGWNTPQGLTSIAVKTANPVWHVPPSIQKEHAQKGDPLPAAVRSGPDNPLGLFALRLSIPKYLIHGTNKPYGIGMQVSHGCIQMYPENIETLFKKTAVGTPVRIVHQPYLAAWDKDNLYLEVHEPLAKWAGSKGQLKKQMLKKLREMAAKQQAKVDWARVENVFKRADGIPTPVLENSPDIVALIQTAEVLPHPGQFFAQPVVENLEPNDWAVLVAKMEDSLAAQQLVAMLNHQGPMIPARKITKDGTHQVIAGPFSSKREAQKIVHRLRTDFEITATPVKPQVLGKS